MILEYHRPQTIADALALLARPAPPTRPLAGGTVLNRPTAEAFAVVDLQALGLDAIRRRGAFLEVGATTKLEALRQFLMASGGLLPDLAAALLLELPLNLRQAASAAGTLLSANGRSLFRAACLALDAHLVLLPGEERAGLGARRGGLAGRLVSRVELPLDARLACEAVRRTPADFPLVLASVAAWPSGRVRLVVGGFGSEPRLVLDGAGATSEEAAQAARQACLEAGDDFASAEYRAEMAALLSQRGWQRIFKAE